MSCWLFASYLLTAFGTNLPFHKFAYNYLPLISFIRLPALFRIFFILPTLIISGVGLAFVINEWPKFRKYLLLFLGAVLILSVFCLILIQASSSPKLQETMSNHPIILSELRIGLALIAAALAIVLLQKAKGVPLLWVGLFLIDLLVHTHLCAPYTVYDARVKHDAMPPETYVTVFPIPDNLTSWQDIIHENPYYMWENAGCYRKKVEWNGRNPLIFREHERMVRAYLEMDSVMRLPIAFFPSAVSSDTTRSFYDADTIFTTEIQTRHYDSTYNSALRIREFSPKQIVIETRTNKARPLVLCQNITPWWQATTETGERLDIVTADHSLLCVQVPQGEHSITFKYHRPILHILFILECIGMITAIVFVRIYNKKDRDKT